MYVFAFSDVNDFAFNSISRNTLLSIIKYTFRSHEIFQMNILTTDPS